MQVPLGWRSFANCDSFNGILELAILGVNVIDPVSYWERKFGSEG